METRWPYTTSENFPALVEESKGVCVIPMGCVEKHGLHLPLGTDNIHSERLAYMASQLESVCVFPQFYFGDVCEGWPSMPAGSITLPVETEMLLLEQLCEQISRNGFKKIVIYNGHGGNTLWLPAFLRRTQNKKKDYVVMVVGLSLTAPHSLAEKILAEGPEAFPELTKDDVDLILKYHEQNMRIGHACFGETAYLMGICPDSVKLDRLGIEPGINYGITKGYADRGIVIASGGCMINNPQAFSGDDPIGCNERIGAAALRMEAERAADVFKFIKEDDILVDAYRKFWELDEE